MRAREHVERISTLRRRIREADESVPDSDVRDLWRQALNEIEAVRLFGDLVVAAFFEGRKHKDRELRRSAYAAMVAGGEVEGCRDEIDDRRSADPPFAPLHWEIEFPEVFERETFAGSPGEYSHGGSPSGFDALVGNPPFAGGSRLSSTFGRSYLDWLLFVHHEAHGNADLVAHFFRRAFTLMRDGGTFGLIATNTIAQGDTRSMGLRWICTHGGEIYHARRRLRWPGQAAVVVSVVHVHRGPVNEARRLDNASTDAITAFLFHRGGHDDPIRLAANAKRSYLGSKIYGQGFTFDDTDGKGVASPLAEHRRLIAVDPHNQEAIFPYIGGEEVNTSPTHAHHRYVINFCDYPLRRDDLGEPWVGADDDQRREWLRRGVVPLDYPYPVAADWPELLAIVEARVKPERLKLGDNGDARRRKEKWWLWGRYTPALFRAITGLNRVLAISQVGQQAAFAMLPSDIVYSHALNVFPFETHAAFCVLQSRPHEMWARFLGSSMKDDLRYTPSDCFETFPFPDTWEKRPNLEAVGESYYDFRADLMARRGEGLTKIYNHFHDPHENAPEIVTLRSLHAAMDRVVLDAYGWIDIPTDCEFLLDYEIDEEEWGAKKKPYRYRWPDDVRDEVLARLLELNTRRAAEEVRAGEPAKATQRNRETRSARNSERPGSTARAAAPRPLWRTADD